MKKLVAFLLSLCLLLTLVGCAAAPKAPETEPAPETEATNVRKEDGEASFTVIVIHSDGKEKTFTYTTTEEFVGPVLEAEGLISGNDGPYGLEITQVDGEKAVYAEDKAYWALYEGEEYATQGADTTPIEDGDRFKLVYTLG